MANVKLNEKRLLEQLQAKITIKKGIKISQQELLDKCIKFADRSLERFINDTFDEISINKEKIERIKKNSFKSGFSHPDKTDDEVIYGLVSDK